LKVFSFIKQRKRGPFDRFDQLTAGKLPPPLKLGLTGRIEEEPDAALFLTFSVNRNKIEKG